ncbi:MAG: Asp-tRNA(Asn)/Glu-tRNA(Gln) amidotransferase subunit GatC [Saprospiraceae bacterium]
MQIDNTLISKLENLARLELSEKERQKIQQDLNAILEMVAKLESLETNEVEPLVYLNPDVNVWRKDEVKHQVDQAAALKNAPNQDGTYFKVPKVIDL